MTVSLRGHVLRTYWGWLTGSTSGKGWEKVAAPDGHAATPQTPPMNHSATSARSKVWMTLEKQKERRKKRRRRQQSSTALHRGLELPNASAFHGERRAARSLTWGDARGVGGSVAAWTFFFFFLKEKPDGLHDDWVNLTENEGWSSATMRRWVTLLLWAPSWKLEGGAIVEWEQLSGKNEFSLHLDLFSHVCWLGNKINVEKNKKLHKRLNPSIFCICKKKKKKVILTLRPGKPLMPVPPTGPCEAPQKHTLSIKDTDGITHPPFPRQQQRSPVSPFLWTLCVKLLD